MNSVSGLAAKVGYCQGMAFVTGIVLMYLPEEPAFQVRSFIGGISLVGNACLECGLVHTIMSSASCT